MKRILPILLIFFLCGNAYADCRGCCSHHGGVICDQGVTKCRDGSPLSAKCKAKGCEKCDNPKPAYSPSMQPEKKPDTSTTYLPVPISRDPSAPPYLPAYDRKDWPHWTDDDNDCQNTRSEILIRDNVGTIKFKRNKPCNVSWGMWVCPYTGKTLYKASDVDIDHIVPLSHAHAHGGAYWTRERKREFANDPLNLIAVEDNINQEKGGLGPDEWKPPLKSFWPEYARRWRAVKAKYGLVITESEERALQEMEKVAQ